VVAAPVVVTAADVDARRVGVGRGVAGITLAVGVVRVAVARSEVAISVRMHVTVHTITRAGVVRP